MLKNESSIDYPKEGLDKSVWNKQVNPNNMQETYYLTNEAQFKIDGLIQFLLKELKSQNIECQLQEVHIVGSICSTQYTESGDIDVHVLLSDINSSEEIDEKYINSVFRSIFENYKKINLKGCYIGKHPLELYYQENQFQDLMSDGCYNFYTKEWLVGPQLTEIDYNPYSDMMKEIQTEMDKIQEDIRNSILGVYETAFLCYKISQGNDSELLIQKYEELKEKIEKSIELFDNLRRLRKVVSDPSSAEEAIKNRNSRKWKIFNSTFKLLNKFGYLGILREFKTIYEIIDLKDIEYIKQICGKIVSVVKNKLGDNTNLNEIENLNEDVQKLLSIALIASLLAIPLVLPAKSIEAQLKNVPAQHIKMHSPYVQNAVKKGSQLKESYGGFESYKAINIVAMTIYCEAQGESLEGKTAVASVIYNRAGGDPNKLVGVCLKNKQFSEWNVGNKFGLKKPTKNSEWKYTVPKNVMQHGNQTRWAECVELATKMFLKDFQSNIGTRNMISNKKLDNKAALDSWGQTADLDIGNHSFGYDKSQDGYRVKVAPKPREYEVKSGDNLGKIAKQLKTTVDELVKKNNIDNPNKIRIGQKLKY